ncbi:MAG: sodium:solute symporter family transporter [Planctomycetota bacterium]|jgi:SSS family transporter
MRTLGPIDWVIFAGYLAVIFAMGVWLARGQRSNEDYFVAGRRMSWLAVGLSLFATAFSSLSFVALPREGAYVDYHLFLTYLFIPLVITPVLWWLFVPVYIRLKVTSVYEYLEIRFNRPMRRLGTLLFALYAIGWMGSMVYATGLIVKAVLHLDRWQFTWTVVAVGLFATLYTTLGGIKAVIWTDVLQAATLGGGMLVVFLLAAQQVEGGWATIVGLGIEHDKFQMFDLRLDLTRRSTFLSACSLGLFMYLPGYTTSQVTVQRYVCMRNLREARRALLINAAVATVVASLFFFVGTTLFAFYHQPGASGFPELDKQDQILPHFVLTELRRPGLAGLLLAGLFAAVMSTIDSGINSLTAVVAYDWLSGRSLRVVFSRLSCALFGLSVIGAALLAPYLGQHVIDIISIIAGSFLGLLLGVFLMGMLVSRANTAGAITGLCAGAASLAFVWTQTDIHGWWYGAYTCLPTFGVGVLASYIFRPPRPDQLKGLACKPRPT